MHKKVSKVDYKSVVFFIVVALISLLLYRRDIGGVQINKFIFLAIISIYALIADYRHVMMLTAFVLPLTNGLPGNFILPILCVFLVLKGGKKLQIPRLALVAFLLIITSEFIHIMMLSTAPDIPGFIGYCAAIFLMLFVGGADLNESDNWRNALWFSIGSAIMLSIIMMNFSLILQTDIMDLDVRVGDTNAYSGYEGMSLQTNANNIGLYSIAAISISFALWYYKKIPIWLLVLIAIPSFIVGINSFSRTWALCLVLFGFLFLLFRRGKSFAPIVVLAVAIIGVYFFFTNYSSKALEVFIQRFSGDNTAGGRTTLFTAYNDWMFTNTWSLIVGVGAQTYKEVTNLMNSTHNAFQQILLAYGLPGLAFFLYLFYKCIKKWHTPKERMVYMPLIVVLVFLQSLQFLNPVYCMFPFIASFFILKMLKQDKLNAI